MRINIPYGYTNAMLKATGPVQPEFLNVAPDEATVRMTVEGVYTFTASATGSDGLTYQDSISIIVLNKTQLDTLLRGKWEGMKGALMALDIEMAVSYFVDGNKNRYTIIFSSLTSAQINEIFANITDLKIDSVIDSSAECGAIRNESDGTFSYPVTFVKNKHGAWKIMGFSKEGRNTNDDKTNDSNASIS